MKEQPTCCSVRCRHDTGERQSLAVCEVIMPVCAKSRGILDKTDVTPEIVRPADSYAVIGSDGNAYFLSSGRISVVSPAGVIVRTIRFNMVEGSRATRIFESSTNLVVQTTTLKSNGVHQNRYLLIDGTTGKSIAVYEPSPELGNVAVDFSRNEGLTFIKRDRSTLKLLTAVLK